MAIHFTDKEIALFKVVAKAAATLNTQAFAVGGFVRDKILDRPTKDIDIVCLGDGMQLANEVAKQFNPKPPVALFKTFGTAQIKFPEVEVEFVGARKESYSRDSRKPSVTWALLKMIKIEEILQSMLWLLISVMRILAT